MATALTAEDIIDDLLMREGSAYTDHPADKGGPTKWGITQMTLSDARGYPVTEEEVRNLGEAEARRIYMNLYILGPHFTKLYDDKLIALAVDSGVNHRPKRVVKWLQEIAGVPVDGILGPITASAINAMSWRSVYKKLLKRRIQFYGEIITKDHTQAVFAHGWMNRVVEFIDVL